MSFFFLVVKEMSVRFDINNRSDYIAEYNRLQKKVTAKIAAHQGPCGEDGDRGEDATGLVTTSSSVATFLCNLMQFIEGPEDVAIDEDTQATPTPTLIGTYTSNVDVDWYIEDTADAQYVALENYTSTSVELHWVDDHSPDYETKPTYTITLAGIRHSNASVIRKPITIRINDVDDTPPILTGSANVSVQENTRFVATYSSSKDVVWNLGGTDAAAFEKVDETDRSVTIQFQVAPDYETDPNTEYNITLSATDKSVNANVASIDIQVTVTDVDDTTPTIGGNFQPTVQENTRFVGTYTSSEVVTWTVTGDDAALFMLDGGLAFGPRYITNANTVDVYFITAPDFKNTVFENTYNINLIATDAADNSRTQALTITVTDVDDADEILPVILSGPTTHTIAENSTTLVIGTYTSSEDIETWALTGTDANDFTLTQDDNQNATLALKASPDYETKSVYNVSVTATDLAGNTSAPTALVVTVTDVDEIAPVISGNTSVDKLEGTTNKAVGVYTANEPITSWTLDGDDKDLFNIDNMGDQTIGIILKSELEYDYETKTRYELILTATDATGNVGFVGGDGRIQVNVLNDPSDDPFSGVLPVLPSGYVLLDESNNLPGMKSDFTIEAATDSAPAKLVFKWNDGTNYRTYEYHAPRNRYEYFDNADLYSIVVTRNSDLTYHLTYTNKDATSYDPVLLTWVSIPNKRTGIFIKENTLTNNTMVFTTALTVTEWKLGGADANKFEWINKDASSAQLQFKEAPDFEAPGSADGEVYRVQLQGVVDGVTYQQDLTIQVINAIEITGPAQLTLPAGAAANQIDATYTTDRGTTTTSQGGYNSMHTWAVLDDYIGLFTLDLDATPQQAWLDSSLVDAPNLFGEVALQLNAPAVAGTYLIQMAANTFDGTYNQQIEVGSDDVYFTFHNEGSTTIELGGGYGASQYTLPRAIKNRRYKQQITLSLKPQISIFGQIITLTSVVLLDILNLPNGLTFKVLKDGTEVSKTELTDVPVPEHFANMQAYVLTPGTDTHATYAFEISGTPTESQGNIQLQLIIRGLFAGLLALNVPTPFDKDVVPIDPTYTITTQMLALTSNPFIAPLLGGISNAQLESTINVLLPRFQIEATDTADLTHDVTVIVNNDNVITVSAGQQSDPYYTFTANGASITKLQANTTYVFQRQDNATSHPFSINDNNPITGTETVTVTTGAAGSQIPWVCTSHSSMKGSFNVV